MNVEKQRSLALRNHLKALYTQARGNLLLAIILTAVNIAVLLAGSFWMLLFSATVPYFSVMMGLADESGILLIPCVLFALAILAVYFLCWLFSKKSPGWMIAALVLFSMDTLCLIALYVAAKDISGILDLAMHALILYYLISGVRASKKLEKLPPEEITYADDFRLEDLPPAGTITEDPAEEIPEEDQNH